MSTFVIYLIWVAMDIIEFFVYSSMVIMLVISLISILSHRSTLYWSMAMFCHTIAPLCIISWLWFDWVIEVWIHIVSLVAIALVNAFMDSQCIGLSPCFESVYIEHGYAYLEDDTYIIFYVFLHIPTNSPIQNPCYIYFVNYFGN